MRFVIWAQRALLILSYNWHRLPSVKGKRQPISWVIGPDECASMVYQLSNAVPDSYSVNFSEETSYGYNYDFRFWSRFGSIFRWPERVLRGPLILGKLIHQARGLIFVGSTGFLLTHLDERKFEFKFIRRRGLSIACYWCGSDIRSIKRMHELEARTGEPNISTYMRARGEIYESLSWDEEKRKIATVANEYANVMFSNSVDHLSYLATGTEPFLYFLPRELKANFSKFKDLSKIVIVHATTAPEIKGTPLVRAAISALTSEGYDFEYVELIGVPNSRVRQELSRAHISMNQFYGFSPAVFGVESLASGCAVMMSADETVETDLPIGSNDCWVVTKHHEVYKNLKRLLDNPNQLEKIARKGREWAEKYAMLGGADRILAKTLERVLDGSYVPPEVKV